MRTFSIGTASLCVYLKSRAMSKHVRNFHINVIFVFLIYLHDKLP